jgi:hypothetical protein
LDGQPEGNLVPELDSKDRVDIEVDTIDGGEAIRVGNADFVARFFFTSGEGSAGPESVDERAMDGSHSSRFEETDLQLLLGAKELRRPSESWEDSVVVHPSPPWLTQLDPSWDLMRTPEASWVSQGCAALIEEAFEALYGGHERKGFITKLLYPEAAAVDTDLRQCLGRPPATAQGRPWIAGRFRLPPQRGGAQELDLPGGDPEGS